MTRAAVSIVTLALLAWALRRSRGAPTGDMPVLRNEPDDIDWLGEFSASRNSATYLYNARTGVLSSYN